MLPNTCCRMLCAGPINLVIADAGSISNSCCLLQAQEEQFAQRVKAALVKQLSAPRPSDSPTDSWSLKNNAEAFRRFASRHCQSFASGHDVLFAKQPGSVERHNCNVIAVGRCMNTAIDLVLDALRTVTCYAVLHIQGGWHAQTNACWLTLLAMVGPAPASQMVRLIHYDHCPAIDSCLECRRLDIIAPLSTSSI